MQYTKIIHFLSIVTCIVFLVLNYFKRTDLHESHLNIQHTKITLYVDTSFDDDGYDEIVGAALDWTVTTHHLVEYDVVRLPAYGINIEESIFISNVSPNFPEIIQRDHFGGSTLGIYFGRMPLRTILLVGSRLDEETYRATVLHELGHSLGLEHSNLDQIGTLMYPFINLGANFITNQDLEQFCQLHQCDVKTLIK